ncbi:hypothetical protein OSB04_004699 [Centaurea solstitialis]|uniref:Thylakoid lumenal 17.9 kDa protein n=1 Tax=Centaurea solstitialis TaxID=347529 RepID=A0AA38TGD1_9ASTR|nr:hypothetical protein OSB04_004699 [Centaurea solstitialis]
MSFWLTTPLPLAFSKTTTTTIKPPSPILVQSSSSLLSASISSPKSESHPFSNHLLSLAIAIAIATLTSPLPSLAIPSLNGSLPPNPPPSATTPFSQSKNLITGLENGRIRACPANNPGCVSSNPKSSSFAFPWRVPEKSVDNAVQQLQEAILETQKNAKIEIVEDTPDGHYLLAMVDGGFGRDVLEFLVRGDVVSYRCMASKVTYIYPFTTALGDSKGQEERIRKVVDQLGWDAPSFNAMD